jgi:hypothetical protein
MRARLAPETEPPRLPRLRVILAMLIAMSLALSPVASARAMINMAGQQAQSAHKNMAGADAMSDCHGSMQPVKAKHCPCCDTHKPAKAPCQDGGDCLIKCGMHVLAILAPSRDNSFYLAEQYWPAEPEKPPDRFVRPPAPPPRS